MDRRRFALAVTAVVVGGAGCLAGDAGSGTDRGTEYQTGVPPEDRLTIGATGTPTATVRLYPDRDTDRPVDEATYELAGSGERRVTTLEPDGYVVVLIDGRPAWNETVGSEDRVELSLSPDGTATVTGHAVS